jgi:hypothetical protein
MENNTCLAAPLEAKRLTKLIQAEETAIGIPKGK